MLTLRLEPPKQHSISLSDVQVSGFDRRREEKVLFASLNYGSNLSFLPRLENQKCLGPELTKPGMRPPGDRF